MRARPGSRRSRWQYPGHHTPGRTTDVARRTQPTLPLRIRPQDQTLLRPTARPSEPDLAKAKLAHHAVNAARTLAHLSEDQLLELFHELPDLPERDLKLLVALPELVSPELARLYRAIAADNIDHADELLPAVLDRIDTPQARAQLADAVADLQAARRIDPRLAAAAHIDLDSRSQLLFRASLIQAAALAAGATRTPGGLLLAA